MSEALESAAAAAVKSIQMQAASSAWWERADAIAEACSLVGHGCAGNWLAASHAIMSMELHTMSAEERIAAARFATAEDVEAAMRKRPAMTREDLKAYATARRTARKGGWRALEELAKATRRVYERRARYQPQSA